MRGADTCSARPNAPLPRVLRWLVAGLIALAAAGGGAPLVAHQTVERWGPWLGCWELEPQQAADEVPAPAIRTCVTRTPGDPGVRISTTVAGAAAVEETFVADGAEWPIEDGPCRGMRLAEWSRTGHRLFSRARIECTGSPPYRVSHLASIAGDTWLDIQGITREAHEAVRVRRYRRIQESQLPSAITPSGLSPAFSLDDVKEASRSVTPLVLEAALVETHSRFVLNGRTMLDLDRAGVPDEITDVMVALSYPDRFKVHPRTPGGSSAGPAIPDECGIYDTCVYGWDPFGYTDWRFDEYWESGGIIIVEPPDASGRPPEDRGGRVVNHRGYTRIEPVQVARGESGSTSTSSTASSGDSGSNSSGASSQGYSSGSSGGDSGRTAQPRPPE
jgi:hypothetical protein